MFGHRRLEYVYLPIWGAMVVHITQAICMIHTSDANSATDITTILDIIPNDYAPAVLIIASGMAFISLLELDFVWSTKLLLLIPQQSLITMAVYGVVIAIVNNSYADGTPKPGIHIFVDQIWIMMYMIVHAYAVTRRSSS